MISSSLSLLEDNKERFLDHFPISDDEFNYIWSTFDPQQAPYLQWRTSLAQWMPGSEVLPVIQQSTRPEPQQQQQQQQHHPMFLLLEFLLPELPIIFQWILHQNVFVVGFIPFSSSDGAPSSSSSSADESAASSMLIPTMATFLETVTLLSGRRSSGPSNQRLLLEAIYYAVAVRGGHDSTTRTSTTTPTSSPAIGESRPMMMTSMLKLMNFMDRLATISCRIQKQMDENRQQDQQQQEEEKRQRNDRQQNWTTFSNGDNYNSSSNNSNTDSSVTTTSVHHVVLSILIAIIQEVTLLSHTSCNTSNTTRTTSTTSALPSSSSTSSLGSTWWSRTLNQQPGNSYCISKVDFIQWVHENITNHLHLMLYTIFHYYIFFAKTTYISSSSSSSSNDHVATIRSLSIRFPYLQTSNTLPHSCSRFLTSMASLISNGSSQFWTNVWDPIPIQLSLMGLGGPRHWYCLYRNDTHGLHFFTFAQALLSYAGPTCLFIQTKHGDCLGYYTELPWKVGGSPWYNHNSTSTLFDNSNTPCNNTDCIDGMTTESFLFRLVPNWTVYRHQSLSSSESSIHYYPKRNIWHQYLNINQSHRPSSSTVLHGLAVGGIASNTPRLHLTPTLEQCQAGFYDHVFQSGNLLGIDQYDENNQHIPNDMSNDSFDVDSLEVWAIYDNETMFQHYLQQGHLQISIREQSRIRQQKVDRHQFINDFVTGSFPNNLYAHRGHIEGSD